jgi:hypothetical protein
MIRHFNDPWSRDPRSPQKQQPPSNDGGESLTFTPGSGAEDPLAELGTRLPPTSSPNKPPVTETAPSWLSTLMTDLGNGERRERGLFKSLQARVLKALRKSCRSSGDPIEEPDHERATSFSGPNASEPQVCLRGLLCLFGGIYRVKGWERRRS